MIVHKIQKCGLNLMQIYKTYRLRTKMKNFLIWQTNINTEKTKKKNKKDIKEKFNKL